jgi:pyruvate/2-oxoglutarate/acetoin dehydrogenase E1 component
VRPPPAWARRRADVVDFMGVCFDQIFNQAAKFSTCSVVVTPLV